MTPGNVEWLAGREHADGSPTEIEALLASHKRLREIVEEQRKLMDALRADRDEWNARHARSCGEILELMKERDEARELLNLISWWLEVTEITGSHRTCVCNACSELRLRFSNLGKENERFRSKQVD